MDAASHIHILPYQPQYEAGIQALCRIPVSGNIALALEREPDYYAGARVQCRQPEVYVCLRPSDQLVCGVFNIGFRPLYYQGSPRPVRYLCDLRIHPQYQGSALLFRMIRFVDKLNLAPDDLPAQTVVFSDNRLMLDMIGRRARQGAAGRLPYYHPAGELVTTMLTLAARPTAPPHISVRPAAAADIPAMQSFWAAEAARIPYCPHYNFNELHLPYYAGLQIENFYLAFSGGDLQGICGIWNQKDLKQTRIAGYSPLFRWLRPLYNAYAAIAGKPLLPAVGRSVYYFALHSLLVRERSAPVFSALLARIIADARSARPDYLLFSLDARDPLLAAIAPLRNRRQIKGRYFLVNNGAPLPPDALGPWFYLEATRI